MKVSVRLSNTTYSTVHYAHIQLFLIFTFLTIFNPLHCRSFYSYRSSFSIYFFQRMHHVTWIATVPIYLQQQLELSLCFSEESWMGHDTKQGNKWGILLSCCECAQTTMRYDMMRINNADMKWIGREKYSCSKLIKKEVASISVYFTTTTIPPLYIIWHYLSLMISVMNDTSLNIASQHIYPIQHCKGNMKIALSNNLKKCQHNPICIYQMDKLIWKLYLIFYTCSCIKFYVLFFCQKLRTHVIKKKWSCCFFSLTDNPSSFLITIFSWHNSTKG